MSLLPSFDSASPGQTHCISTPTRFLSPVIISPTNNSICISKKFRTISKHNHMRKINNNSLISANISLELTFPQLSHVLFFFFKRVCKKKDPNKVYALQLVDISLKILLEIYRTMSLSIPAPCIISVDKNESGFPQSKCRWLHAYGDA